MKGQEAGTLLKEGDQREYHGACHYRTRSLANPPAQCLAAVQR